MKKLALNWLTEGQLDFEYKKYILLAYLQEIGKKFKDQKLYPSLSDLIMHYSNLVEIKRNKKAVSKNFPKDLKKANLNKLQLEYTEMIRDPEFMRQIQQIMDFAIPAIKGHLEDGTSLYEFVEDKLEIFPVGVVPLNSEQGYILFNTSGKKDTRVYEFEIKLFESAIEKYRAIKTEFVTDYIRSYSNTYENIKIDLIKKNKNIPNPATYAVESKLPFPLQETLLPVVKRWVVRLAAID